MRSGIHEGLRRKRRDEGMRAIVIDQSKSSINGNRGHRIKAEREEQTNTALTSTDTWQRKRWERKRKIMIRKREGRGGKREKAGEGREKVGEGRERR